MHPSRALIGTAVCILAAAVSMVPQVAGGQSPSTSVLIPANGATVSGNGVVLDASASSGVTQVQFELTGGLLTDSVIATATPTIYGWIAKWNSTTVADGTYTLQSVAASGSSARVTSTGISINVSNGAPSVSIVLPSADSTLSGAGLLDAVASPGVTSVGFAAVTGVPGVCSGGVEIPGVCDIGAATLTEFGWLVDWDTSAVPSGNYLLIAVAKYPNGASTNSSLVGVLVTNAAPAVVLPKNNSSLAGSQLLDCVVPSGLAGPVQFWVESSSGGLPQLLGAATPTIYGWLYGWNTSSVSDGMYSLYCTATYPDGGSGAGTGISITVTN